MSGAGRMLIVDDERLVREVIGKYAMNEGYEVYTAQDGVEAVNLCKKRHFNVIIMDIRMPRMDGFTACREIRKDSGTALILLTALGEEYDRIHGFELGVDDYIVKPFSPKELMLRVRAILRRYDRTDDPASGECFEHGGLNVDFTARKVSIEGQPVVMTPREYDLLFYLVRNRGVALTRDRLIRDVWNEELPADDRTLDTHIKRLRRLLGEHSRSIVTLRKVGYRFDG
ncbi:response regulator transcription factor [Papillibacter cinnamivorans]|uniref:Stage 0 sporulation protein A homolog n=1 Tax=Papillibacter cinnamivorans DSM 12816 TaxID=1122930 RepID=A0A1W2A5C5_9FIRM|nr:response regulator transcription factor [Papillibacter cinnamivorans]SMC55877.1 DNA-binding response regulator, OmpR family, contains REC and winged-helix (wHTH) domain [Papillibacter cinnamivorans DSM 12816]